MMRLLRITQRRKLIFVFMLPILTLCLMGCKSDDDQAPQEDLRYLRGNYVGTWNSVTPSQTYTDFNISARIQISATNEVTGTFFYTKNFNVCCSEGENDGTFKMEVNGNTITTFRLDDVQTDCTGVFIGSGTISESEDTLVIDFTGDDCKGDHVGQMILVKQ